jgi:hypothetical protein
MRASMHRRHFSALLALGALYVAAAGIDIVEASPLGPVESWAKMVRRTFFTNSFDGSSSTILSVWKDRPAAASGKGTEDIAVGESSTSGGSVVAGSVQNGPDWHPPTTAAPPPAREDSIVASTAPPATRKPEFQVQAVTCWENEEHVDGICECIPGYVRAQNGACVCDARVREMFNNKCVLKCSGGSKRNAKTGVCQDSKQEPLDSDLMGMLMNLK